MLHYYYLPYNKKFPILFRQEEKRLRKFLRSTVLIEHFGSTAVQNLGGKGIIDVYVVVPIKEIGQTKKLIEKAGYEVRPHSGTNRRFVFVREENNQRYHLHLTDNENEQYKIDLAFRDYLRTHPNELEEYAKIKEEAAKRANQSKEEYMRIKKPVINKILSKITKETKIYDYS